MVNTHIVLCTQSRYHSLNKNFEASPGSAKSSVWFELEFLRRIPFHVQNLDMCQLFLKTMVIAVTVSCEKEVVG